MPRKMISDSSEHFVFDVADWTHPQHRIEIETLNRLPDRTLSRGRNRGRAPER
jgi:hypothetical protein